MKIDKLVLFFLIPFILFSNSCSKKEVTDLTDDFSITVFTNQSGNPDADALQAQIVNTQQNYQINLYGTFSGGNGFGQTNTVTYHRDGNDTIVYLLLDPGSHKLQTAYIAVSGIKQPWVIKHDYVAGNDSTITISIYDYDWAANTGELKYQAMYETNNGVRTETPLYAAFKTDDAFDVGAVGFGFVVAEAVFYGTNVSLLGTAAGAAIVGAVGTIVSVGLAVAVVGVAIAIISSDNTYAADLEPGDYPLPSNAPVNNPAPPTNNPNNPTPNLYSHTCDTINVVFNASMDLAGSILITNPLNVSGYQYSLNGSPFQVEQVFDGPYTPGNFTVSIKTAEGCIKSAVRYISNATPPLAWVFQPIAYPETETDACDAKLQWSYTGGVAPYTLYLSEIGDIGQQMQPASGITMNGFCITPGLHTVSVTDSDVPPSVITASVVF